MPFVFVDNNSDLSTLDLITKSMSLEDIEKSVDKSKCVQVERQEPRGKNGKMVTVKRWLRPDAVSEDSSVHKVVGNHHLLNKDHSQYQEESEATKPKEPKRKRKPKDSSNPTKQSKSTDSKPKAPRKKRALGSSPLENPTPAPTHNVIDAAEKAHKRLQEQKSTPQSDGATKPDPSLKQKVKDDLLSKQQPTKKRKSDKPTRADNLPLLKAGEQIPSFITEVYKIPPGWKNVRVADSPDEKWWIIAEDSEGRTQGKQQPEFRQQKQNEKWERCTPWTEDEKYKSLQKALKEIANRPTKNQKEKDKNTAVSECLQLMLATGIRPGSEDDTKAKTKAYGATTLQANHLVKKGTQRFLQFTGKDGVKHNHEITDPKLKKMLDKRKTGAEMWKGKNGQLFDVSDDDLRKTLEPFDLKPKDLRTICAMRLAQQQLKSIPPTDDPKEFIKVVKQVCNTVCAVLGNRSEETFKSYIAPSVWQEWSPNGLKNWQNAKNKGDADNV